MDELMELQEALAAASQGMQMNTLKAKQAAGRAGDYRNRAPSGMGLMRTASVLGNSQRARKAEEEAMAMLQAAMDSQSGMGQIQAQLEALKAQQEMQAKAGAIRSINPDLPPGQAQAYATLGEMPGGSSGPTYKDFVDPETGATFTHIMNPDGSMGDRVGMTKQAEVEKPGDGFDQGQKLRKEFLGETKDFQKQTDAYGRVVAAAKEPSAAGDLALIFNYMKVLDPGSVVRESEFENAARSGSLPARVQAAANKIYAGERLSDEMRMDFVGRAGKLYESAISLYGKRKDEYWNLASRYGLDPNKIYIDRPAEDVVSDLSGFRIISVE